MCGPPAQPIIVRFETAEGLSVDPFDFCAGHTRVDCANHAGRHLILQLEDVLKCTVISICPQVRASSSLDQLARYSDAVARFPDTPLKNVPDP
jgi:hypothetical protein